MVEGKEIVFSDILEVRLGDGSRVRGCFALHKRTRAILGMAFDYHMRADLVVDTIQTMTFQAKKGLPTVGTESWNRNLAQKNYAPCGKC